jgi:hypothetical protein
LPRAIAPPAVRSRRRTGFIWCGLIIERRVRALLKNAAATSGVAPARTGAD